MPTKEELQFLTSIINRAPRNLAETVWCQQLMDRLLILSDHAEKTVNVEVPQWKTTSD